jgi:hypothetical protein
MKKNLLKAVLLVITMMVGGTNSAWADGETVQVTITSEAEVATYCNCDGKALDFSSVEGLTAYIVSSIEGLINLQAVKKIPAGTGVVVAGEPKTYNVPVIASADPVVGNLLIGVTSNHSAEEGDYVLAYRNEVRGFFQAEDDVVIPAGKAYLHIDDESDARSFLPLNYETTGIGALLMNNEKVKKEIFSLSGQRVSQPKKGLYIIGGRKVVVK